MESPKSPPSSPIFGHIILVELNIETHIWIIQVVIFPINSRHWDYFRKFPEIKFPGTYTSHYCNIFVDYYYLRVIKIMGNVTIIINLCAVYNSGRIFGFFTQNLIHLNTIISVAAGAGAYSTPYPMDTPMATIPRETYIKYKICYYKIL